MRRFRGRGCYGSLTFASTVIFKNSELSVILRCRARNSIPESQAAGFESVRALTRRRVGASQGGSRPQLKDVHYGQPPARFLRVWRHFVRKERPLKCRIADCRHHRFGHHCRSFSISSGPGRPPTGALRFAKRRIARFTNGSCKVAGRAMCRTEPSSARLIS